MTKDGFVDWNNMPADIWFQNEMHDICKVGGWQYPVVIHEPEKTDTKDTKSKK